jgi:multicomponent Na+:H+ antiporter subunit D
MIADNLPVLVIIVPLFIGVVLPVFARRLRLVEGMVVLAEALGLVGAGFLAYMVVTRKGADWIYQVGGWPAPWGIELTANSLAVFFLAVVMVVSLPIALFTIGNLRQEVGGNMRTARFYTLFLLLVGSLHMSWWKWPH